MPDYNSTPAIQLKSSGLDKIPGGLDHNHQIIMKIWKEESTLFFLLFKPFIRRNIKDMQTEVA